MVELRAVTAEEGWGWIVRIKKTEGQAPLIECAALPVPEQGCNRNAGDGEDRKGQHRNGGVGRGQSQDFCGSSVKKNAV